MIQILAIFLLLQAFLHYGAALYLLESTLLNWKGKFFGELFASMIITFISLLYLGRNRLISLYSKRKYFTYLAKYCTPLVFHLLGLWVMGSIDRIMLSEIKGLEIAGIYFVAYTIGMSLDFLHNALSKVWTPWFYRNVVNSENQTKDSIVSFTYSYIIFGALILMAFINIVPYLFEFFIDERYLEGTPVIVIVAFGYTLELVRKLFVGYLFVLNKTILIASLSISTAILNILLNIWLIPNFGMLGAAWATTLSYLAITIATIIISSRINNMPWNKFSCSIIALYKPFIGYEKDN